MAIMGKDESKTASMVAEEFSLFQAARRLKIKLNIEGVNCEYQNSRFWTKTFAMLSKTACLPKLFKNYLRNE